MLKWKLWGRNCPSVFSLSRCGLLHCVLLIPVHRLWESGDKGEKRSDLSKIKCTWCSDAQRSMGASAEQGAGTSEMYKMTNSANFTVTNVARIKLVHLHWKTSDCACWEALAHRAVWREVRKQKSMPILQENKKIWRYFRSKMNPRLRYIR